MTKLLSSLLIIWIGLIWPASSQFIIDIYHAPFNGGPDYTFTPLHTYFISPSGSDTNTGLSPAQAWLSPYHVSGSPVGFTGFVCGDLILAQAGTYSISNFNETNGNWPNPGTCPSTTGGIDGAGGVNFVTILCAGTFVGACMMTVPSGINTNTGFYINGNNWAIEGFRVNAFFTTSGSGFCYVIDGTAANTIIHHVAFINNMCVDAASATFVQDDGVQNTTQGGDYWAVIGMIAQNAAGRCDGFWDSSLDVIGIVDKDTVSGTHIFFSQNFAWPAQQTASGCDNGCNSDGEAMMFDTLDAHAYSQRIVSKNNLLAQAEKFGYHHFYTEEAGAPANGKTPVLESYNNTQYASNLWQNSTHGGGEAGCTMMTPTGIVGDTDIFVGGAVNITYQNNISLANKAHPTGLSGINIYGEGFSDPFNPVTGVTIGGTGKENIIKGLLTACDATCDTTNSEISANPASGTFVGTDIWVDPLFKNTSDFLSNQQGVPNCGSATNTVACEGWNYVSQTAANPSPIYDLTPTCTSCAGKGYQPPPLTCGADSDYPTWLKGVVYLQASGWTTGATITEKAGLVLKPCGY